MSSSIVNNMSSILNKQHDAALFTDKKYYQYLAMIGKGGFGKVWRVKHLPTGNIYALKEMSKAT